MAFVLILLYGELTWQIVYASFHNFLNFFYLAFFATLAIYCFYTLEVLVPLNFFFNFLLETRVLRGPTASLKRIVF